MIAEIEQADGSYVKKENGSPECGEDFCDTCGDCLDCYPGECVGNNPGSDPIGPHRWVIYK